MGRLKPGRYRQETDPSRRRQPVGAGAEQAQTALEEMSRREGGRVKAVLEC